MLSRGHYLHHRYRIIRPLGKGGFGQVYEALDDNLASIVAIKERFTKRGAENRPLAEKMRRAFEREAQLLANLRHPVLPKVIDHFFEGVEQYLVMEFIEGDDLVRLLSKRQHPFSVEQVFAWADELLRAVDYLHTRTEVIIHRDIKPANIKLTNEGEIFLLDFGLAKGYAGSMAVPETSQQSSSVHGYTAAYAPLEQLTNSGTNQQSDIYSLGATLYHLLTGRVPITAAERYKSLEMGERDPLLPAHEANRAVPVPLSLVLSHAMAMSRKERLSSAKEMRQALIEARFLIQEASTALQIDSDSEMSGGHGVSASGTSPMPTVPSPTIPSPVLDQTLQADQRQHLLQMFPDLPIGQPEARKPPVSQPSQDFSWPSHVDSQAGDSSLASTIVESELMEEETSLQTQAEQTTREAKEREEFERQQQEKELARQRLAEAAARQAAEEERLREGEAERQRVMAEQERQQAEKEVRLKRQAEKRAARRAEAKRQRQEQEEIERKEAEAVAKRLADEQESARLRAEQEAQQRAEEATRKEKEARLEEEARLVAEEARRHAEELVRQHAEEERRQTEAARLRQLEEEEEKQKALEEEEAGRLAEEGAHQHSTQQAVEEVRQRGEQEAAVEQRVYEEKEKGGLEPKVSTEELREGAQPAKSQLGITRDALASTVEAVEDKVANPLTDEASIKSHPHTVVDALETYGPAGKPKPLPYYANLKWIVGAGVLVLMLIGMLAVTQYFSNQKNNGTPANPPVNNSQSTNHKADVATAPNSLPTAHDFSLKQRLGNQRGTIWSVAFAPNGELAASAGADRAVSVWDTRSWQLKYQTTKARGNILSIAFSPDSSTLASGSSDGSITLWKTEDGSLLHKLNYGSTVLSVVFAPDGQTLAGAGAGGSIQLWNVKTGDKEAPFPKQGHDIWSIAFSPDGTKLVTAGKDESAIVIWNVATRTEEKRIDAFKVLFIVFSHDGATLASADYNNTIKLWDWRSGRLIKSLEGHQAYVSSLAFTRDGTTLVSASKDWYIKLWDVQSGNLKQNLQSEDTVETLSLSPDGKTLISGGKDQWVKVWQ